MGLLSPSFEENKMIVEIKVEQNRVGTWDCISFLVDDQYEQNPQTYEQDDVFDTKEEALAEAKKLYNQLISTGKPKPEINF